MCPQTLGSLKKIASTLPKDFLTQVTDFLTKWFVKDCSLYMPIQNPALSPSPTIKAQPYLRGS